MKAILPPDGGPVTVQAVSINQAGLPLTGVLVMVEFAGGPIITIQPGAWNDLVRRIRAARTAAEIGA